MNANRLQTPRFNFKPNAVSMQRKSPAASPSVRGRTFVRRVAETPVVTSTKAFNNPFLGNSVPYKESYAMAMEPMDCDDWEENWGENGIYGENTAMVERKILKDSGRLNHAYQSLLLPCTRNPQTCRKDLYMKKYVRNSPFSNVQQNFNNGLSVAEKPLRQSVICINESNEFEFKLEPKKKILSSHSVSNLDINGQKIYPTWSSNQVPNTHMESKNSSFPRVFTVTVEKLLKWPKVLYGAQFIFEMYGILGGISSGKYPGSKAITLKDEWMREAFCCIYYEIDRVLQPIQKGQWMRCITLLRSNGDYQCLTIRSATPTELKSLNKMVMDSSKEKALLLKNFTI